MPIKVKSLKPNPRNPRTITKEELEILVRSIKEFPEMMAIRPMVVDETNTVLGGNQRLKAIKHLDIDEIPDEWVQFEPNLTDEQKKRFIVADNKQAGEWDIKLLREDYDIQELAHWGLDVEPEPVREQKAFDDDFKIPPVIKTDIQPGDIIDIGKHRLLCGDSRIVQTYDLLMGKQLADMMLTDPPYNVDYTGGTGMKIENDKQTDAMFYDFLYDFFTSAIGYIKFGGAVYVWHAESTSTQFRNAFTNAGLQIRQCLIWVKSSLVMGRQDYQWKHEPCLYGWKTGAAHYFVPERNKVTTIEQELDLRAMSKIELMNLIESIFHDTKTTVLRHDKPKRNAEHPTMKPVLLFAELIENSSKPGQVIIDPFGWSGTTMVVAEQTGRIAKLIEYDPKYCQVTIDRMLALDKNIEVRINDKPYKSASK